MTKVQWAAIIGVRCVDSIDKIRQKIKQIHIKLWPTFMNQVMDVGSPNHQLQQAPNTYLITTATAQHVDCVLQIMTWLPKSITRRCAQPQQGHRLDMILVPPHLQSMIHTSTISFGLTTINHAMDVSLVNYYGRHPIHTVSLLLLSVLAAQSRCASLGY